MPWSPIAPPTTFSNLPQIQYPTQQAPDPGTQMNALATANAQRTLMGAQAQDVSADAQQKQLEIQSQQNLQRLLLQNNGDIQKTMSMASGAGVLLKDQQAWQTNLLTQAKTRSETDEVTLKNIDQRRNLLNDAYQPLYDPKADPNQLATTGKAINQNLISQGFKPEELMQNFSPQGVQTFQAAHKTQEQIKTASEKMRDEAAAGASDAQAAENTQKTSDLKRASAAADYQALPRGTDGLPTAPSYTQFVKDHPIQGMQWPSQPTAQFESQFLGSQVPVEKQPEYGLKNLEFTSAKTINPISIQQRADLMFNPANYSDPNIKAQVQREHDTAVQAATAAMPLGTAAVNKAFTDSSDRIGRLTAGVAQANATIPAKVTVVQAAANAQGTAKETEAGRTAYVKSAGELAQADQSANELQSFVDLAKSGNKIAYAYAPTTGVLSMNTAQGVKRVNMAELKSISGAGSVFDRVQGWLSGHATGASIAPDVLNDLGAIPGVIHQNAAIKHNTNIDSIKTGYGIDFTPNKAPVGSTAQASAHVPHATTKAQYDALPSGTVYTEPDGKSYRKP